MRVLLLVALASIAVAGSVAPAIVPSLPCLFIAGNRDSIWHYKYNLAVFMNKYVAARSCGAALAHSVMHGAARPRSGVGYQLLTDSGQLLWQFSVCEALDAGNTTCWQANVTRDITMTGCLAGRVATGDNSTANATTYDSPSNNTVLGVLTGMTFEPLAIGLGKGVRVVYPRRAGNVSEGFAIDLVCNPLEGAIEFLGNTTDGIYLFHWETFAACPSYGTGLSLGTILLVLAPVLAAVYLLAGVAYKSYVQGVRGWERLPHISLWLSLPGLVWDGMQFTWACITCRRNDRRFAVLG